MESNRNGTGLPRLATGVPGLDDVLGGGVPAGRVILLVGAPGTGKTTLSNQVAFAHAAVGGRAVVATLIVETHDLMLSNLESFEFFDPSLVGDRIHYLSLLGALEDGLDSLIDAIHRMVRETGATLMVVDGTAVVEELSQPFELRRFMQLLQAQAQLLGCTTLLLTGHVPDALGALGAHADGVILLASERVISREVRTLRTSKLRGAFHVTGLHEFTISRAGVTVHPRLEALVGRNRPPEQRGDMLQTGVTGLDPMLGGGLLSHSSTLLMGPPGAGKTLIGLTFVSEGAKQGERGLVAGFHETQEDLIRTASGIGLDLERQVTEGLVRILWEPPLELSVDAWAWQLLKAARDHGAKRVFIDSISDLERFIPSPFRMPSYSAALFNELRGQGATTMISADIEAYVDNCLTVPVPAASATMDNGILVRQVEVHSNLQRLISILKARQTGTDPAIREFVIGDQGVRVSVAFSVSAPGLLSGRTSPAEPGDSDPQE